MKRILILIIGLIGVAYGQSSPTSSKTRFVNGIYLGTKLDSYFAAADSNAIYWRADSVVMAKYKGTARALAFAVSGGYLPISDTAAMLSPYLRRTDSTGLLSKVVRTFGTQTVGGDKTFSNDLLINSLTLGRGDGNNSSNTVFGSNVFNSNTTGTRNVAIGENSLSSNTTGYDNTAIGWYAVDATNTGYGNTGIGAGALGKNTTGSNNIGIGIGAGEFITGLNPNSTGTNSIFIGYNAKAAANAQTNQTVIGYDATGNGSNTVTIGNSSVTDNYFSGRLRSAGLTTTGSLIGTSLSMSSGGVFLGDVVAPYFGISSTTNFLANINTTNSTGGYIEWQTNGTTIADIGTATQVFGSGGSEVFAINGRGARAIAFGTNNTQRVTINSSGTVTLSSLGTGTVYSNSGTLTNTDPSDSSIKNTINPHKYGLAEVLKLQPKSFYYNSDYTKSSLKYGFIAQEVEKIMPDMVRKIDPKSDSSKLGLESQGIYVTMVKAIQEQQEIIEQLKKRIANLEAKLN